jgi:hypothetical protein
MTTVNFEFGDLAPKGSADQRLFDECVVQAARGRSLYFPLSIRETARVPFVPDNSEAATILEKPIAFDLVIRVFPEAGERLTIRSREPNDASSGVERRVAVWVGEEFSVGVGLRKPRGMGIPDYLAKSAVEWMETGIEAALKAGNPGWEGIRGLEGDIAQAVGRISIMVDDIGTASITQKQDVPRLLLVEDPIFGKDHFYSLALTETKNTAWMDDWMRELLTFPLGDYEGADAIRTALVRQHCPKFDDTYGYDHVDARIEDEDRVIIGRHDGLLSLDPSGKSLAAGIRDFGQRLAMALPPGNTARKDILMTLREAPDEEDVIEACDVARREHPDVYTAFLEAAGWDHPFDPLDVVVLKRRYAVGLPPEEWYAPVSLAPGGPQV